MYFIFSPMLCPENVVQHSGFVCYSFSACEQKQSKSCR